MNTSMKYRNARIALTLLLSVAIYAAAAPSVTTDASEVDLIGPILENHLNSELPLSLSSSFATAGEFRFITPIAPNPHDPDADFDADMLPYLTVTICKVVDDSECTLVKTFTSTTSPDRIRIENKLGKFFIVNWTTGAGFDNTPIYRISVDVPSETLGTVDLPPSAYRQWGRTWPIKFIIEKDPALRIRMLAAAGNTIWDVADNLRSTLGICGEDMRVLLRTTYPNATDAQVQQVVNAVCQDVILAPNTKIADAATRDALSFYDIETGRMIFANETALLKSLKVDDVIVSKPNAAAPFGYLRKVGSVRRDKGIYTLETVQASLTEAIHQGTLDASGDILPTDELPADAFTANAAFQSADLKIADVAPQSLEAASSGCVDASSSTGYHFECSISETFDRNIGVGEFNGTGHVTVSGKVFFSAGYDLGVGVELCADEFPPVCMDRFEARLRVKQKSEVHVDGQLNATVKKEIVVARKIFKPITFWIGPIPVVIFPVANLVVGASGHAQVNFTFDATTEADFAVGAKWTDPGDGGKGWEKVGDFVGPTGTADGSIDGNLTLIGYYKGNAKLLLYGVVGPSFGAVLGGRLFAQIPGNPVWSIYGHIAGDLAFEVSIIDVISLSRFDLSYFVVHEELIGKAPNFPPRFFNIDSTPVTARPNEPVYLGPRTQFNQGAYEVMDPEGELPLTVVAQLNGTTITDSQGYAVFTEPGTPTVTIIATDKHGATASLPLTVNVLNQQPVVEIYPSTTSIPATAQFFATIIATDPDLRYPSRVGCTSLDIQINPAANWTRRGAAGNCVVWATFDQPGPYTLTIAAADASGGPGGSRSISINVTPAPPNPYPEILEGTFSVLATEGPARLLCIPGERCEAPSGVLLSNEEPGEDFYKLPIYMYLNAVDPGGTTPTVTWVCETGAFGVPVTTNNPYGEPSCVPSYSSSGPVKVYAIVRDSSGQELRSEPRIYRMLQQGPN